MSGLDGDVTFFCHECNSRIEHLTESFTCPQCSSGFVEQVEDAAEGHLGEEPRDEWNQEVNFLGGAVGGAPAFGGGGDLNHLFQHIQAVAAAAAAAAASSAAAAEGDGGHTEAIARHRAGGGRGGDPRQTVYVGGGGVGGGSGNMPGAPQLPFAVAGGSPLLQDIFNNLATVVNVQAFDAAAPGADRAGGGGAALNFVPGIQMYGNPGDYAWGRGGLDVIVTQLLNQMDGTGPPPLKGETIEQIPKINVRQEHIVQKVQCSVCWEDFVVSEEVRQLNCDHIYHEKCIIPWLELHGTCPVCRKSQEPLGDSGGGGRARSKQSGQFVQWRTTSSRESENATTSEAASSLGGSEAGAGGGTHENPVGNAINSIFNLFGLSRGSSSSDGQVVPEGSRQDGQIGGGGGGGGGGDTAEERNEEGRGDDSEAGREDNRYRDLDID